MSKISKRKSVKGELRDRIAEDVLAYVRRNGARQIPNQLIADRYGVANYQVSHVTKHLVAIGMLERVSRYTYAVLELGSKPRMVIKQLPLPKLDNITEKIVAMAKDFVWETNSDSLREFIKHLKK